MHPFLEDGRVDAAEVHVRIEIALDELGIIERWHLAVMTTLDLVAEDEGHAGGAMIGAGAVVTHAPAELREYEDDHVVGFARALSGRP